VTRKVVGACVFVRRFNDIYDEDGGLQ
jgi:hypothetical protein